MDGIWNIPMFLVFTNLVVGKIQQLKQDNPVLSSEVSRNLFLFTQKDRVLKTRIGPLG